MPYTYKRSSSRIIPQALKSKTIDYNGILNDDSPPTPTPAEPNTFAEQLDELLTGATILPSSCIFWKMRNAVLIRSGRTLPDDYIYLVVSGAMECEVAGEKRLLREGEFMLVPMGVPHCARLAEGVSLMEAYALHFHVITFRRSPLLHLFTARYGRLEPSRPWFKRLAVCSEMMTHHPDTGKLYLQHLVREFLIEQLLNGWRMGVELDIIDERISHAINYIRSNLCADLRVPALARICALSAVRFRQLFRQMTGESPNAYVRNARLKRAQMLLLTQPHLSVKEISVRSGFNDVHYFHQVFRNHFGAPPKGRVVDDRGNGSKRTRIAQERVL